MARRRREKMSEGKKNIIAGLIQEYDIKSAEDIQEALKDLLGGTIQEMMEAELDEHLGYDEYERSDNPDYRNGVKHKKLRSSYGEIPIDVPQDRDGDFEPQIVQKRKKDISAIEQKIIAMSAKGMTIKKHNIDISDYENCKYQSFNDFFARKKNYISIDANPLSVISPCDGYLSVYKIDELSLFNIKNTIYDLRALLKDEVLAEKFKGGTCFIFRLTPHHFHRYPFIDDCVILSSKKIPGILHTVRPIACERYPV